MRSQVKHQVEIWCSPFSNSLEAVMYTFTKRVPFFETLTTKSPILVREKTAPIQAQMTTKIHTSATVIKNPSKQQHVKSYAPTSEDQWKESSKTLVIFRKALQN